MAAVEVPQTIEYRGGELNAASVLETKKNKSFVSATPLSTAFFSSYIVQDSQDSHEYLNDLEEEYQARALLAKFKRFFKKGPKRPKLLNHHTLELHYTSSNANRSKTPTKSGSKVMASIQMHWYIVFTKFDEKRGTIFNSNKEIVMFAPQVRDVYVLDMTYSAQESCFLAKASENLNWL
ncbi:hypothetical protein Tco_0700556 [Tanacetum coccineum]